MGTEFSVRSHCSLYLHLTLAACMQAAVSSQMYTCNHACRRKKKGCILTLSFEDSRERVWSLAFFIQTCKRHIERGCRGSEFTRKSCSFFLITFLSSDLHYVITSWTVIFKFPHLKSFILGTRQSVTSLLQPGCTRLLLGYFIWPCSVSDFVSTELRKSPESSVAIHFATYL